ncbi:MAG: TIGR02281 family clan AA aspartic protease [Pseudomonadales bacterium]|nr:TIGR02281 family clan AA aspartic protease [Pseudomonadales bacterium]
MLTRILANKRLLLVVWLLLFSLFQAVSARAVSVMPPVEVVGLFKDRAMLKFQGKTFLLRVGETAKNGTHLIHADAQSALVRFDDSEYRLTLSNRVRGRYKSVDKASISIMPDGLNQFRVRGSINQRSVNFLVDTGASVVAMSEIDASAMGVDYLSSNERGSVITASGEARSYFVVLDMLEVGGIRVPNVKAAVIVGSYPAEVLLGMSFLSKISMKNEHGVMILQQ